MTRPVNTRPYYELHAHSAYSFLYGANHPHELVQSAAELGLAGLGILDYNGLYAAIQLNAAGLQAGIATVFGAELTLEDGTHLPVIARNPAGYTQLSQAISVVNLQAKAKKPPAFQLAALAAVAGDNWLVLTGQAHSYIWGNNAENLWLPGSQMLAPAAVTQAENRLGYLKELFGAQNVSLEATLRGNQAEEKLVAAVAAVGEKLHIPVLASGKIVCATQADQLTADVLNALCHQASLEKTAQHRPPRHRQLCSPDQLAYYYRHYPQFLENNARIGKACAFDLRLISPELPPFPVPAPHNTDTYLHLVTQQGAEQRYGPRAHYPQAWEVIDNELKVIADAGFSGYFLIVHDIVQHAKRQGILVQGRGSAANSAVCYALGITAVDAVKHKMLFARFLSPGRRGYPDIDLDIESGRREEIIQYVYQLYGREHAALVANVITYRHRLAVKDAARALGHSATESTKLAGSARDRQPENLPSPLALVVEKLSGLPRHLGTHPGGMVLCGQKVSEICPVQWAHKAGRSVLQWDKDDCAAAGLVKFDLLGLGMLTALRLAFTGLAQAGVRGENGAELDLYNIPGADKEVYALLQAADTVGVFQVESRAQMATLPRLRPQCFYDLVVEVALIRPGPLQGKAVNPYLRRRNGKEPVTYPHPLVKPALEKTLGIALFQEQIMQMSIDAAGFSPEQADALRVAMGAKRQSAQMQALKTALMAGMQARGIPAPAREEIFAQIKGFADFGFPESHAFSFAYIVYASAYLKVHHPEYFYAALLAAQPMGFYSPMSLVADARRHGVKIGRACVQRAQALAQVQAVARAGQQAPGAGSGLAWGAEPTPPYAPQTGYVPSTIKLHTNPQLIVRLGLGSIRGLSQRSIEQILAARHAGGEFTSLADLVQRVPLAKSELQLLIAAGATDALNSGSASGSSANALAPATSRRQNLWQAGFLQTKPAKFSWYQPSLLGSEAGPVPVLPALDAQTELQADIMYNRVAINLHPLSLERQNLQAQGVLMLSELARVQAGTRVRVAGIVTHRQRPATAAGVVFLSLEDESGLANVVCTVNFWHKFRVTALNSSALIVRGIVQKDGKSLSILADQLQTISPLTTGKSRDFT